MSIENFSQERSEVKELDWVKEQISKELASLNQEVQQEVFYTREEESNQVTFNMDLVKTYLMQIQDKPRSELKSSNTAAWMMAVQIALEKQGYDTGKIDGIYGETTKEAVKAFQAQHELKADGLPGSETIKKLLEVLGVEKNPEGTGENPEGTGENPEGTGENPEGTGEKPEEKEKKSDETGEIKLEYPPQVDLSQLGVWEEETFLFHDGVEQQDKQGTYIELEGKKFYKNAKNGLGYKVGENSDGIGWFYAGEWKDSDANGKGVVTRSHGDKYEGEFKDDDRNGKGTETRPDGRKYEGEWKDGRENGKGTETRPDVNKYEGEWKDGLKNGKGTETRPDGTKYEGEWKDGLKNGKGTETRPDGRKYEGEYKDGRENGKGTYTRPDGSKYEGEWKDHRINGKGTLTTPSGKNYTGIWEDGVLQSDGTTIRIEDGIVKISRNLGSQKPDFMRGGDSLPNKDRSQQRGEVKSYQEGKLYTLESWGQSIAYEKVEEGWKFKSPKSGEELLLPPRMTESEVQNAANLINKAIHTLKENKKEYGVGLFEVGATDTLQIDYSNKVRDVDFIRRVKFYFGISAAALAKWLNTYRSDLVNDK